MEFKFRRNGSWNHPEGINSRNEAERNASLFVDNVQIERRRLPTLDLGVINKQLHSFSTTTIVHDAYQPRSPPSPMTITNHDA